MSQNSNILYLNFLKKSGISSFLKDKPNNFYKLKANIKNISTHMNIDEIKSLTDLKILIRKQNFLKFKNENNKKLIIGEGNENAKIFIIGEFSDEENQQIKPFTNESKKLLDKMLNAINLDIKNVYIANVIPWPIDNQMIKNDDILECLPFIQKQIEIINPKIILLMGSIAAKAILNSNLDINKLRGKWHDYKSINLNHKIKCLVTYHPKYLIKFPKEKKYAWEDLQKYFKKQT